MSFQGLKGIERTGRGVFEISRFIQSLNPQNPAAKVLLKRAQDSLALAFRLIKEAHNAEKSYTPEAETSDASKKES